MKITSIKSLGIQETYSPEMKSEQHNYILDSGAVHKNSHGVSYCLITLKCLWLKAHFAPEYWACVMSGCHPDKIPRYMSVSRSEGWTPTDITYSGKYKPKIKANCIRFGTLNINSLTKKYTVTGDVVNQGLIGVKGIGKKAASIFEGEGNYNSLDQFVCPNKNETDAPRKNKAVLERLIKLGAFSHLPDHNNSQALWMYYLYHYSSDSNIKKDIAGLAIKKEGWNDKTIAEERNRQEAEYKKLYPKRNKIPSKISKWKPSTPNITLRLINKLFPKDFTLAQKLQFQKDYLGFYLDSPMDLFETRGNSTIREAKEFGLENREVMIEAMITAIDLATTKPKVGQSVGSQYAKLTITDGIQSTLIFVWKSELERLNPDVLQAGVGIRVRVNYDSMRNTFSMCRNTTIRALRLKDAN